jgi:hypothetical protein
MHELQLDDELVISDTLDAALRRIRSGYAPRVLFLDLADSAAPIAEVSSARTVGGAELKLVALRIRAVTRQRFRHFYWSLLGLVTGFVARSYWSYATSPIMPRLSLA